jgi:hypothetical protein
MNKAQTITTAIGAIIMFFCLVYGVTYGHVDYNWEQDKCSNMKGSTYEFSHDVQLGADYASHCYWYQNHPMAYISNILLGILIGIFMSVIPWIVVIVLNESVFDYW